MATYGALTGVRNLSCDRHDEQYPCLWISRRLPHLIPCLFTATRSTAVTFSEGPRKRAREGKMGMKIKKMIPHVMLMEPNIRKMYIHCGSPEVM